ncbi:hypothetical protein Taro_002618 [Colocasia esculenta]|uniref:Uncharacterized protein n=1 Tax=Colocasia esculenta TaxID=4460 RepID=A0A843TLE2_COLES|nr:hypothetical protein [Colocasia esculenta]
MNKPQDSGKVPHLFVHLRSWRRAPFTATPCNHQVHHMILRTHHKKSIWGDLRELPSCIDSIAASPPSPSRLSSERSLPPQTSCSPQWLPAPLEQPSPPLLKACSSSLHVVNLALGTSKYGWCAPLLPHQKQVGGKPEQAGEPLWPGPPPPKGMQFAPNGFADFMQSTSNRTLDQQCTVTRPGLAPIASALAVELLVGILHHPDGMHASADLANSITTSDRPLGILPHQIRGSFAQFSQLTLIGYSSNNCTACCTAVVSEYRKRGMEFVLQAINRPTYLEDLTGLTELMETANSFQLEWDDEADEDADI